MANLLLIVANTITPGTGSIDPKENVQKINHSSDETNLKIFQETK